MILPALRLLLALHRLQRATRLGYRWRLGPGCSVNESPAWVGHIWLTTPTGAMVGRQTPVVADSLGGAAEGLVAVIEAKRMEAAKS